MINFGLKAPKVVKEIKEKYDFPVITLEPAEEKGKSSRISFNKACYEQMEFSDDTMVVFGRNGKLPIFIDGKYLPVEQDDLKRKLTIGSHSILSKDDCQNLIELFPGIKSKTFKELEVKVGFNEDLSSNVGTIEELIIVENETSEGIVLGDVPVEAYDEVEIMKSQVTEEPIQEEVEA